MNRRNFVRLASVAPGPARQRGVALAVVLILLLVMTLLALAAMRGTLLQERMGSSQFDRSLGFQATEAALREAEVSITTTKPTVPGSGCTIGICATPVATDTARWLDEANWDTNSIEATATNLGVKPRYIVEWMGLFDSLTCTTSGDVSGGGCTQKDDHYRITARSSAAGRADVMLQSNFIVPHAN